MAAGVYFNPHGVPANEADVLHQLTVGPRGETTSAGTLRLTAAHRQPYVPTPDSPSVEPPTKPAPDASTARLSPQVKSWLVDLAGKKRKPDDVVEVVLTLRSKIRIPLLPPLGPGEKRGGPTRRSAVIREIETARRAEQTEALRGLPLEVTRNFWIGNVVVTRTRLGDVSHLLKGEAVHYIESTRSDQPAPADGNPLNDVVRARGELISDPYYAVPPPPHEWLGLLDSGVRRTHVLLTGPARIEWWRDTVNGDAQGNASALPGFDPDDRINHGTSSAAILSGTTALGDAFRGLSTVKIDSWRVYDPGVPGGFALIPAVLAAIQAGLAGMEEYLVINVQAEVAHDSALGSAADDAFDAGAIVVAPNGNLQNAGANTVACPANAHKVLGVGAFVLTTRAADPWQRQGGTPDGRIKPDVQAPGGVETASNASDLALRVYEHTSCAAPVAAGAAVLCHRWLRAAGWQEKGLVYAYMILYGQRTAAPDNIRGAGPVRMLVNAGVGHGRFTINHHGSIQIPVDIGPNRTEFNAAIWWPESSAQTHSRIDLMVTTPNGTRRTSNLSGSVFQKIRMPGGLQIGQWTVTIAGHTIPNGTQDVYLAIGVGL